MVLEAIREGTKFVIAMLSAGFELYAFFLLFGLVMTLFGWKRKDND